MKTFSPSSILVRVAAAIIFAAIIGAVLLLTGCNKPDPRVAKLEARVITLESNVTELTLRANNNSNFVELLYAMQTNVVEQVKLISFLNSTATSSLTVDPATGLPISENDLRLDRLETQYSNLVVTLNGKPSVSARTTPAGQSYGGQMPAAVAAQIRRDAETKWDGQYDMQVYEIKKQSESWQKLHP